MDRAIIEKIRHSADEHFEECRKIADYMTDNPEVGLDNRLAAGRISELLRKKGFEVESNYCGIMSAFRASKGKSDNRPKAAILVETDALPEVGHACGHSLSAGASLLAAFCAESVYDDLPFNIELIGTPGEEFPGGKVLLDKKGAFDGYEFAIMTHMDNRTYPDSGFLACNDRYITFTGKASHASDAPEKGINALNAARLYMDAMDMWRQHIPRTTQIQGVVEFGGDMPSTVPDRAVLNYYFRARTLKELDEITAISDRVLEGVSMASGAKYAQEQRYETYADFYRNPVGRKIVCDVYDEFGIEYIVRNDTNGSSDIGNVDQKIPCFHLYMAATDDPNAFLHDKSFAAYLKTESGYQGMKNAGMSMTAVIGKLGMQDGLLDELKKKHREYRSQNK
jgi:Metal-dependent amidase/aminoacylase/carboxypeptidase